jgi:hypothetical protein
MADFAGSGRATFSSLQLIDAVEATLWDSPFDLE